VRSDFEIYFRGSSTTSDSESSTTGSDISQYWNKEARLLVDEMSIDELRQAIENLPDFSVWTLSQSNWLMTLLTMFEECLER
jgi:hypothetical protein